MLHAAVVIPVVRYDEPHLLFVRRADHLRRNPGQIGFPGGVIDPTDRDAKAAALREFEEEMGVPRERVRIVDRLEDVVTLALSVTVAPYLGVLDPPVEFAFDPSETQSIHEIPLDAVYRPGALHQGVEPVQHEGVHYDVPTWMFDHEGIHIWGATARILYGLLTRYRTPGELLDYLRVP
jgi:8-oxo-dGTP pyrophosphatase MutT (NUDIX family)